MALTPAKTSPSALHIVDADCHTYSPKDMWDRYLPKKFQADGPKLVKDKAGGDAWQFGPDAGPAALGVTVTAGMRYEDQRWFGTTYEDIRPGCYDGKARLADMDEDGVDVEILYSDNRPMSYFLSHKDSEYQLAAIQAYNNWLFEEFCSPDPSRLIGIAQMPNLGVDGAIAEAKRNKDRGAKGVLIRTWPSGRSEISEEDDRFWAACQEMELAVCNHGFLRSGGSGFGINRDFEGPIAALWVAGVEITSCITQLIASGVHDRFPDLKFGAIETQAGWLPWFLWQMNDRFYRNRVWGRLDLQYLPSEYWTRNWFVTFINDPYGVDNRHYIGVDTMMWSSDYPHHGNDWPYSRKVIDTLFFGVPVEERRRITCDNAIEIFHLNPETAGPRSV